MHGTVSVMVEIPTWADSNQRALQDIRVAFTKEYVHEYETEQDDPGRPCLHWQERRRVILAYGPRSPRVMIVGLPWPGAVPARSRARPGEYDRLSSVWSRSPVWSSPSSPGWSSPPGRPTHAAQVQIFQVKSETVFADFESTDSTGCILTAVFLVGGESIEHAPPGGQQMPTIAVEISQFNLCTNTLLLVLFGESSEFAFHMSADLSTATLAVSQLQVADLLTGTPFVVAVNVTWDGTGSVTRQAGTAHFRAPGMVMNAVEVGFTRAAQATGTIVNGTTNYIPGPSSVGEIQDLTSGQITVTMP